MKRLITIYFIIFSWIQISGQERGMLLSKYYSSNDYLASTQNWAIAQDKRGILYFGNGSGILEFDGSSWRHIFVENKSSVRSLAFDSRNILYAGAYNEIGFLTPNNFGELSYHSLNYLIDSAYLEFGDVWTTYSFSDTIYFLTDHYLFRFVNGNFYYWESKNHQFYLSFKVGNELFVHERGKGLFVVKNDSLVLIEKGEFFQDKKVHCIISQDKDLIIGTREKGIFMYKNSDNVVEIKSIQNDTDEAKYLNKHLIDNYLYYGIETEKNNYAFSLISGEVVIVDKNWKILDIIDNETIGTKASIHYLFYQKDHCLWMALDNGICQVEIASPFRYWNNKKGLYGSFTDVAEIDNYHYVSTSYGVFYTPKTKKASDITLSRFYPVKGNFEQTWGFLYFQPPSKNQNTVVSNYYHNEHTILLAYSKNGIFQINGKSSEQILDSRTVYNLYQYKKDPTKLFFGLDNGIGLFEYQENKWEYKGLQYGISGLIKGIGEDTLGNLWISAEYRGLYRVQNPLGVSNDSILIEYFGLEKGLPSLSSIHIFSFNRHLYFNFYDKNYFYNEQKDTFERFVPPAPVVQEQEEIKNSQDDQMNILSGYRFYYDVTTDSYITSQDDTSFWFGSINGIYRHDGRKQLSFGQIFPTVIRQITTNDSVVYYGANYKLNKQSQVFLKDNYIPSEDSVVDLDFSFGYYQNSLEFTFSSPFYIQPDKNQYSYYLEGYDKEWSEWKFENKCKYNNIPEGDYVFKVKSRNIYTLETPVAEFKFTVLPPWYRSFAAFIGYTIIGILLIVFIVKLYTYRLIREKDKLEKIVIERTQEILMQKEEILVQAEHLKDANQEISARNEELKKQKYEITNQAIKLKKANFELNKLSKVASETGNAIMIFDKDGNLEWVNDGFTKIYEYTLEEFKEERSSNIITSSSNPNIKEAILSCINEKKSVVYKFNTKSKSGKDIWVQTTLTNVVDKDGNTTNFIAIESDITELKQAEIEIAAQRDQLVIANATKNKFFRIIAHDLRNPISTLAGSTSLILNDFDIFNKEQTKNFIGELNKLSQTTYNLLENLLDWATAQTGEMKFNPKQIDVLSLLRENIELIKRRIDDKEITLTIDVPENTLAFADENMVKTIIRNLLSNAVKFTPEGGHIAIKAYSDKDFVYCEVTDNGIGISNDDLQKLFKIDHHYTRLGLSNEKGSGLGLILCKEFVEKNGGKIEVNSKLDKGTTIKFSLQKLNS